MKKLIILILTLTMSIVLAGCSLTEAIGVTDKESTPEPTVTFAPRTSQKCDINEPCETNDEEKKEDMFAKMDEEELKREIAMYLGYSPDDIAFKRSKEYPYSWDINLDGKMMTIYVNHESTIDKPIIYLYSD